MTTNADLKCNVRESAARKDVILSSIRLMGFCDFFQRLDLTIGWQISAIIPDTFWIILEHPGLACSTLESVCHVQALTRIRKIFHTNMLWHITYLCAIACCVWEMSNIANVWWPRYHAEPILRSFVESDRLFWGQILFFISWFV